LRPVSVLTVALLVGAFTLFALFGPVSEQSISPRPAEAAAKVKVSLNCTSNPEKTKVKNNTNRRIKVKKVGSIYRPYSYEPIKVNRALRPGKSITFQSGNSARGRNVLTRNHIYNNDVGKKEGARVATSVGRFNARC
jgi:hypothetical protein